MTILKTIPESEVNGLRAEISDDDVRSLGYVPSHTKAISLNLEAYMAWESLTQAISSSLGLRRYDEGFTDREIAHITLAAAARNFFSRALLALNVDLDVPAGLSGELQAALL